MVVLTFLQSVVADYLNIVEVIFLYRLSFENLSVKLVVRDLLIGFLILAIPMPVESLYLILIILYLWLVNREYNRHTLAIVIGVLMGSLYGLIDHCLNLLFIGSHKEPVVVGWLIPIGDLLISIIIGIIIAKFLKPKYQELFKSIKNTKSIWYGALLMLVVYEVVNIVADYEQVADTYYSLILAIDIAIISLGGIVITSFIHNYVNEQQQQQLILNYQEQLKYAKSMNEQFGQLRRDRHDMKNMLLNLQGELIDGNTDKANQLLSSFIQTKTSNHHYQEVDQSLEKLHISGLRNLIQVKAYQIIEQGSAVSIDIPKVINQLPGSEVKTARIVGILLDNALESIKKQDQAYVQIAILSRSDDCYDLVVANSLTEEIDINQIMQYEYSTKPGHQGIGLSNLNQLINQDDQYALIAEVKQRSIIMTCTIQGKVEIDAESDNP
ncbi:GHKL domain-containing protein [Limosilactobacillus equigenerosi]|uniref:Sensor histidine kinase NatK-like C-terminal domain-containing protein n=1 Tax=Limosilactobacillus equigenerosi DSM 18793 = JCM 14505 TaxID=1423742 RepID=A0A0R1UTV8_9LACO|nr:GHKL domain-containing protein [Limosilactobacillus equigenerosi]KRL95082.1 hypothetical protein FC21_GL001130 [Limosilactobacillus equigenerosi DSM 18793 = JCM 14505]